MKTRLTVLLSVDLRALYVVPPELERARRSYPLLKRARGEAHGKSWQKDHIQRRGCDNCG
nr:MAG TPA: hypothetical protein [Caudoviricetes sp.]